jgi:hypothetical protein
MHDALRPRLCLPTSVKSVLNAPNCPAHIHHPLDLHLRCLPGTISIFRSKPFTFFSTVLKLRPPCREDDVCVYPCLKRKPHHHHLPLLLFKLSPDCRDSQCASSHGCTYSKVLIHRLADHLSTGLRLYFCYPPSRVLSNHHFLSRLLSKAVLRGI